MLTLPLLSLDRVSNWLAACGLHWDGGDFRSGRREPRGKRKPVRLDFEPLEKRWLPAALFDLSSATYSISETGAKVTLTVNLTDPPFGGASVDYATSDGSAAAGSDYTSASGTLSFLFGTSSRTFDVFITDDMLSESNETFTVTLSNPVNAGLGSTTSATVTITNATPTEWDFGGQFRTTDLEQGDFYPYANALVALQTGDLFVSHGFDYRRSLPSANEAWSSAAGAPALVYRSQTAHTLPILEGVLGLDSGGYSSSATSIQARLTWNGGSPGSWVSFTVPAADGDWMVGLQVGSAVTSSGFYSYQIDVKLAFSNRGEVHRSATGDAYILVNDNGGALGAGWSLAGVDRLVPVTGGLVWLYGAGGQRFFAGSGGTYTSPANDFGTLVKNVDNTYTYTAKDQIVRHFDTGGKLARIVDPHNETRTFTYSGADLTKVEEPDGGVTTFSYASGKLTKVEMPGARTLTVTVDGSGDLTVLQNPDGALRTFTYDADHLLLTEKFSGQSATFAYDSARKVLESITWGGVTVAFDAVAEYGMDTIGGGRKVASQFGQITDGLSQVFKQSLDAHGRVISRTDSALLAGQQTETFVRNGAGQVTQHKDRLDRYTTFTYDGSGDLTAIQRPDGSLVTFTYDGTYHKLTQSQDSLGRFTTYTYTSEGDLRTVKNALGEVTTYAWDSLTGLLTGVQNARGHSTDFFYDGSRRLQAIRDALLFRTTFTYDAAGNIETVKDALGRVATFQYDGMRRATKLTDALGGIVTLTYNGWGQVTSQIDPMGRTTNWGYDARGLNTTIAEAVGTGVARTTTMAYDAALQLQSVQDARGNFTTFQYNSLGLVTAIQNALAERTTFTYDGAGQRLSVRDARGNFTTFTYTSRGWVESVQDARGDRATFTYDTEGNRLTSRDALNHVVTYGYDALNRVEMVKDALNHVSTLTYDAVGNLRSLTDPLGNKTTYTYDEVGQRTKITDALNNPTTLAYDGVGNLVNLIDPSGNQTTFIYDALNRQTQEVDALGKTLTYGYDAVGNVTVAYDRVGRRRDFAYDELDRVTREQWIPNGGGAAVNTLTFTYDLNDNLLTALDANGTYTFTYDALDRADTSKDLWNKTLTFTYDAVGNRTKVQDSFGGVMTSVYNAVNLLESRQFSGVGAAAPRIDFTYDAALRRATARRYSDQAATTLIGSATFSYDNADRLENVQQRTGAGTLWSNATYAYDNASRLTSETLNGSAVTFGYDVTHQVTNGVGVNYGYDASGNRNNASQSIGTGNRLNADLTWTYTYDHEGNLTRRSKGTNAETWDYTYDHRKQMVSATKKATQAGAATWVGTYTYDVFGNRVKQEIDADGAGGGTATATKFAYDGVEIWADLNNDNTLQTRYVKGDQIDELFARVSSGGTAAWYVTDRLGSVRNLLNASGTVLGTIAYDAFGNITSDTTGGNGDRWKWTGREFDATLGLQYNRWRFYSPETGRWVSEDPIRFEAGDLNLSRQSMNATTLLVDPLGLESGAYVGSYTRSFTSPAVPQEQIVRPVDYDLSHELQRYNGGPPKGWVPPKDSDLTGVWKPGGREQYTWGEVRGGIDRARPWYEYPVTWIAGPINSGSIGGTGSGMIVGGGIGFLLGGPIGAIIGIVGGGFHGGNGNWGGSQGSTMDGIRVGTVPGAIWGLVGGTVGTVGKWLFPRQIVTPKPPTLPDLPDPLTETVIWRVGFFFPH